MDLFDINTEKSELIINDETAYDNLVDQKSELAQEIISKPPGGIEKWGFVLFLLLVLSMISCTFFISYPDLIEGTAVIVSVNAPKAIICKQDGRLVRLLEKNGNNVVANQIIAFIESTADHSQVLMLSENIDSCLLQIQKGNSPKGIKLLGKEFYGLGEVQNDFRLFNKELELYKDFFLNGFYEKKRASLIKGLSSLSRIDTAINSEILLSKKDVELSRQSFDMNALLHQQKVISSEGIRSEEAKLLYKQISFQQLNVSLIANEAQQSQKIQEVLQLDHDKEQQKIIFLDALSTLKNAVDVWKSKYLIQAPVTGRLIYTIPVKENQILSAGKLIGYVNQEDSAMYAETYLSQHNFGKIRIGLPVYCRFEAFPYQEFGSAKGVLSYISTIPSDSGFFAIIKFENNVKNDDGKKVFLQNGLKANVAITIQDGKLSDRIWHAFK